MIFGATGLAWEAAKASTACSNEHICNVGAFGTQTSQKSATLFGWTVGVGIEGLISDHWLVRAEYRYADYGSFSYTVFPANPALTFGSTAKISRNAHILSAGIAYRF